MLTADTPRCRSCGCARSAAPSPGPCTGCAYVARRRAERAEGRRCHNCCCPLPEGRTHSRCVPCHKARASYDRDRRQRIAEERFPPGVRRALLDRLAAGEHLSEVCADFGVPTARVHGFRAYSPTWGEALDAALLAGRAPGLTHGTWPAYRSHRCRCPECREYKISNDAWNANRKRLIRAARARRLAPEFTHAGA